MSSQMADLPAHIMVDILSRLPVKTIVHCKSVCKTWLRLLSESYFTNLHLSRSPHGLMIHHNSEQLAFHGLNPGVLKFVEIEDEPTHHKLHHDPAMSLDLALSSVFQDAGLLLVGSVNGLVCLWQYDSNNDNTFICNPITREYMVLPKQKYYRESYAIIVYGFGFSSLTGELKVVRIFEGDIPADSTKTTRPSILEGEVYTVGTGEWRSLGRVPFWLDGFHGPFLNGFVHWFVHDQDTPENICAFDFENESFELFPSPEGGLENRQFMSLGVIRGCLCQWESTNNGIVIWVMKEYGIKKSWNKEIVIKLDPSSDLHYLTWEPVYVMKGLKDGTVLMIYYEDTLIEYCPDRQMVEYPGIFERYFSGMAYVPSFLRLKNFKLEDVRVF